MSAGLQKIQKVLGSCPVGELKTILSHSVDHLYKHHSFLINEKAHERSIAFHLGAFLLNNVNPPLVVDFEYNRGGLASYRIPKTSTGISRGEIRKPDLVIHKRGKGGPNLIVIELKCCWSQEAFEGDLTRLEEVKRSYSYESALFLIIGRSFDSCKGLWV